MVNSFIDSRRQGLSLGTIKFYQGYLRLAIPVIGFHITSMHISAFLDSLRCSNGGKHAYYRALRAFYNWLYSSKSQFNLNPQHNPILSVESPKVERKILPSLTQEQVDYLINITETIRDKAIISLLADSGLRLSELTSINPQNINWEDRVIKVRCKGNKDGLAPFGKRTESLLKSWLSIYRNDTKLWDLDKWGITDMLKNLRSRTGLPCNPHTFRRTFASILAKKGIDSLHIMRLGRWESISMVERYTRSVKFEDSLKLYQAIV